jgi:hypothetical protein
MYFMRRGSDIQWIWSSVDAQADLHAVAEEEIPVIDGKNI